MSSSPAAAQETAICRGEIAAQCGALPHQVTGPAAEWSGTWMAMPPFPARY